MTDEDREFQEGSEGEAGGSEGEFSASGQESDSIQMGSAPSPEDTSSPNEGDPPIIVQGGGQPT
jgi:hypothetical protein